MLISARKYDVLTRNGLYSLSKSVNLCKTAHIIIIIFILRSKKLIGKPTSGLTSLLESELLRPVPENPDPLFFPASECKHKEKRRNPTIKRVTSDIVEWL